MRQLCNNVLRISESKLGSSNQRKLPSKPNLKFKPRSSSKQEQIRLSCELPLQLSFLLQEISFHFLWAPPYYFCLVWLLCNHKYDPWLQKISTASRLYLYFPVDVLSLDPGLCLELIWKVVQNLFALFILKATDLIVP